MNAATLVDYSGASHALTPDMQALVAALQNGESTMDLANGFVLPGDGSGTMNVLFITGNYYDINVLEQTNIVSDSDVVLQTLENGESGYVATGANELANDALLVTLGPLGGQLCRRHRVRRGDVGPDQHHRPVGGRAAGAEHGHAGRSGQAHLRGRRPGRARSDAGAAAAEESAAPPPADSATHTTADPLSSVLS